MRLRTVRLGSLAGIPILIHPSWFILVAITTWTLADRVYPSFVENRPASIYFLMAAATVLAFFASIVLHELAHSLVARAQAIPVRSITLFVFGGVAHITREAKKPLPELLMAAAGPLTSMVLGVLFLLAWWGLGAHEDRPFDVTLYWLGFVNIVLGIFNLIPAYPMDGGRVFRSLIWLVTRNFHLATSIAAWTGRGLAWTMIALGALTFLAVGPLESDPIQGLWLILMGLFLENAARRGLLQTRVVKVLEGYTAGDLMTTDPPVIQQQLSVGAVVRGVIDINPRLCYFVEDAGRLAGILSAYQVRLLPEARWDSTTVGEAMIPSARLHAVAPSQPGSEVLLEMENADLTHVPVVQDGQVMGVVGRDRILSILREKGFLRSAAV